MNDLFAEKIAAAKQRELELQQAADEAKQAATRKAQEKASAFEHAKFVARAKDFGHGFLEAVAVRVVKSDWSSGYIELIRDFAEGLLCREDRVLPKVNSRDADRILDKFEYGLELASNRGVTFPEEFFLGQRLLDERTQKRGADVKPERIVIRPGVKPRVTTDRPQPTSNVVELKPAITPKGRSGKSA